MEVSDGILDPVLLGDTARLLACSEDTVRRLGDAGVLRMRRTPGGVRIFSRADVLRVAEQRARRSRRRAVNGVA